MTKHILTIDDEGPILEMLHAALTAQGYRVTGADSAREALRIVKQDPPQLIISDLQLEDSDGLELVEELKSILPNVPIILLTSVLFDPEVIEENVMKKVSAYVPKTESLKKLTQVVQHLLGDLKPEVAPVAP